MKNSCIKIPLGKIELDGILTIPANPRGLVIFVHGSGSSRLSPRNQFVAQALQKAHFATLLFDLLTADEDQIFENRFDIPMLSERIAQVTNWIMQQESTKNLACGYFGASTGAAAAIIAAAQLGLKIKAVVSRGGRPDLAGNYLEKIKSPILLIVGGNDNVVIELNQQAYAKIKAIKSLEIVPGATHLFEEPGTLEQVNKLATEWFIRFGARNSLF